MSKFWDGFKSREKIIEEELQKVKDSGGSRGERKLSSGHGTTINPFTGEPMRKKASTIFVPDHNPNSTKESNRYLAAGATLGGLVGGIGTGALLSEKTRLKDHNILLLAQLAGALGAGGGAFAGHKLYERKKSMRKKAMRGMSLTKLKTGVKTTITPPKIPAPKAPKPPKPMPGGMKL